MHLSPEAVEELRKHLTTIRSSLAELEAILGHDAPLSDSTDAEAAFATEISAEFEILDETPFGKFEYRWPTGLTKYVDTVKYTVRREDTEYVFAIGAEEGGRLSYQRPHRGRIVVFIRSGTGESSYYPLVEFAESDLDAGTYAAIVAQPAAPRSGATAAHLEELRKVPHLANARLERADGVFHSLRNGPSLRLLARREDSRLMLEHAWWVGELRRTT